MGGKAWGGPLGKDAPGMDRDYELQTHRAEDRHWWYRGRRTVLERVIAQLRLPARARILDAGCGSGALALELAARGAEVVAIDISPTLVNLARERAPRNLSVDWRVGDMLDPALGAFDYVVAMDSFIHYEGRDIARIVAELGARTANSILFTVAPRTPLLTLMHSVGRLFPRGDRAPAIAPISERGLARAMRDHPGVQAWRVARSHRVTRGFYISQAMEAQRS
jgi:magnesium-protoporphyrin O-methyltransferase